MSEVVVVCIDDVQTASDVNEIIVEKECLPDGRQLPHTSYYRNGVVYDCTNGDCSKCSGTGECYDEETSQWVCRRCAGTGEKHGPVWLWEE